MAATTVTSDGVEIGCSKTRDESWWLREPILSDDLAARSSHTVSLIELEPSDWSLSAAKRCFDVFCVLLFLPFVTPILLAVALAVGLTSSGPVLFFQNRVGRQGELFKIIKFRTLLHSPNSVKAAVTTDRSERFTSIGRFLRRWKLDELPQLLNVLRGDMSLVGVRPKLPEHQIGNLSCRPGITGAATLAFAQEAAFLADIPKSQLGAYYRAVVLPAKWHLDVNYMAQATFLSDLRIIVDSVVHKWDGMICSELFSGVVVRRNGVPRQRVPLNGRPIAGSYLSSEMETTGTMDVSD